MNEPDHSAQNGSASATAQRPALVSVIIPAFNAAKTIERTLETVHRQTYAPIEIVVVDDVSTDDTLAVIRRWNKAPVTLIERPSNGGPARARNAGIEAATGSYIAFLDADDEWHPEKIARQMEVLTRRDDCTLFASNAEIVSAEGKVTGYQFNAAPPVAGKDAWKSILKCNFVATSSVLTRKAHLEAIGGFDPSLLISQDQDVWIKLAILGAVDFIDEPLARYHIHSGSHIRRNGSREAEFLLPMIERHVAAQRSRLSAAEAREILGMRMTQIGRNAYVAGATGLGLRLILRAISLGYQPLPLLYFLAHASPPGRFMKRLIRGQRTRPSAPPGTNGKTS